MQADYNTALGHATFHICVMSGTDWVVLRYLELNKHRKVAINMTPNSSKPPAPPLNRVDTKPTETVRLRLLPTQATVSRLSSSTS